MLLLLAFLRSISIKCEVSTIRESSGLESNVLEQFMSVYRGREGRSEGSNCIVVTPLMGRSLASRGVRTVCTVRTYVRTYV